LTEARRLAYDRSLAPDDAMRRIRNAIGEYDGVLADPDDDESSGPGRITGSCWGACPR
jgi:hypothetical protein